MSTLFYPHRHHNRSFGGHHNLAPWSRPSSFVVSPFHGRHLVSQYDPDSFGFSQPFPSLFNDTFNQLDQLSSELDYHLAQTFGSQDQATNWQRLLTSTPKFDVKETAAAYILEGEIPGVSKSDISLTWADDNTLVLKTQTSTFMEHNPNPTPAATIEQKSEFASSSNDAEISPAEMSSADPDATKSENTDSAIAKTRDQSTDVAKSAPASPTYHLTERTHSKFQRVFSFAGQVNHDEVKASLKDGVLTVTVPKLVPEPANEEQKTRRVTIEDANENENAEMVDAEKAKL